MYIWGTVLYIRLVYVVFLRRYRTDVTFNPKGPDMVEVNPDAVYFKKSLVEHRRWCKAMQEKPSLINATTRRLQKRVNEIIPEKVHQVVTKTIKELTRAVISGAGLTTGERKPLTGLEETENHVRERVSFYASSAAAEGAITGFGGFFSGMADFPLWLTLKMKLLFEVSRAYGLDVQDYRERLYILHIFQLTFSSQEKRKIIVELMADWESRKDELPADWHAFDWKTFQLDYRDHIDLAKLVQLIPGIGAVAGAWVNHKYTKKLGENAIQALRLRLPEFRE